VEPCEHVLQLLFVPQSLRALRQPCSICIEVSIAHIIINIVDSSSLIAARV
jgi:hypothetical protein